MGIGKDTLLRRVTRSRAATVTSLHDPNPMLILSFSAVLWKVSFGLSRFLLPSGVHVDVVLRCLSRIHSENVADKLPAPLKDLLTDGTDVSPLSNLLI